MLSGVQGKEATPMETVSQCHSEAIAEESYIRNWLLLKDFSLRSK